jgi:hypothetical protein
MREYVDILHNVRARYENQRARNHSLICAAGFHMNCAVLKLRKPSWTDDDPTQITSPTGGIFFSIWITAEGPRQHRADYNIHALALRKLKSYKITGIDFCRQFRKAFAPLRAHWPNVSTDMGPTTLMQGWFDINEKRFPRDALAMMNQFSDVASIIDELMKQRLKPIKHGASAVA